MIDFWERSADPTLRLGAAREALAQQLMREIMRDDDRKFLRDAKMYRIICDAMARDRDAK